MEQLWRLTRAIIQSVYDWHKVETGLDAAVRVIHDTETKQVLDVHVRSPVDISYYTVTIEKRESR